MMIHVVEEPETQLDVLELSFLLAFSSLAVEVVERELTVVSLAQGGCLRSAASSTLLQAHPVKAALRDGCR